MSSLMLDPLLRGPSALPGDAGAAQSRKIEEAAQGFEAVLIRQMLRELRQSSLSTTKSDVNAGYLQLGDEQLAQQLVQSGGLGFARAMATQMLQQIELARLIAPPEMAVTNR